MIALEFERLITIVLIIMTKYLELPDGSSAKVDDSTSVDEALYKAINKYPFLFYVNDKEKCGKLDFYTPFLIRDNVYACGFTAYSESTSHNTESNNLSNISLSKTVLTSLVGTTLGLLVTFLITTKIFKKYKLTLNKKILLIFQLLIASGVIGLFNEFLAYLFLHLNNKLVLNIVNERMRNKQCESTK